VAGGLPGWDSGGRGLTVIEVEHLLSVARRWLGVPFLHQGRSIYGVDCFGLVVCVCKQAGLLPRDFTADTTYPRRPRAGHLIYGIEHEIGATPAPRREAGVLVTLQWFSHEYPVHVALLGEKTMIHSYSQARRTVEHGYGKPWVDMATGFWRLPGVRYG